MRRVLAWFTCALFLGCGSNGSTGKSAGTTTGATSSGATSSSGGATTTGTGGAGTSGAGTGGASAGTGGGGTGGMVSGCTSPSVTVEGDGATKHFDGWCTGTEAGMGNPNAASGYIGVPSPHWSGPEVIWINGCASPMGVPMAGSLSLTGAQAMVGTTTMAAATYDSGTDSYQNSGTTTLTVTELGPDTIAGSYDATVTPTNGNGTKHISGTFRVCRGSDFLPP